MKEPWLWDDILTVADPALKWLVGNHSSWKAWLQIALVLLVTALLGYIVKKLVKKLQALAQKLPLFGNAIILDSARRPLVLLVWVTGIAYALHLADNASRLTFFSFYASFERIGWIACGAWFLQRLIRGIQQNLIESRLKQGRQIDRTATDAVAKLLTLTVLIISVLVVLQSVGVSITGLLAFGGAGGVAVGFAARDLLANVFGGFMVYWDRPFAVGDWIRSPDRDIEGTVEDIGWRITRIRTFDKRPLYVPNAIFTQVALENPSRMTNRRISEHIGVRYDDFHCIAKIVSDIKTMLKEHPDIDNDQTLIVNFDKFNHSSLDIMVYTFTLTTQWMYYHEVKQDVLLKIGQIIESHGAQIAFPTQTMHINTPAEVLMQEAVAPVESAAVERS